METIEKTVDQIREEITTEVTAQISARLNAESTKRLTEEVQLLQEENKKAFEKVINEWKEAQKPPSAEDIAMLVSQEYQEFTVKVMVRNTAREFVIRELPQSCERAFYKILKNRIVPKVKELASLTVNIAEGQVEDKLISLLEMFEPTFDIMADTVALILNPFGEYADITSTWVQDNISSGRQWNIIMAQERANRLRDFFSHVSQASLGGMMTGASSLR